MTYHITGLPRARFAPLLAAPGKADAAIRDLFADPAIAYIHAHDAAHGCFAAGIDRDGEQSR